MNGPLLGLEWLLAALYLLSGLNDLFLDLVFYIKPLRRRIAQGRENPRCAEWELHAEPEKAIAILIPAWDESAVIGAMLESTSDRLDYVNYDIFVGTYPNDEPTQFEVARVAFDRPRIHRVVCPNAGPTSKADCLNWVVEAVRLKERECGKRYEVFVLQDAEDVVHPLALKVFNRFVPQYDLVQLPVIPYPRDLHHFTGNTYLDEFAENHLKALTSRLAVGGMIPSAGVGTAFSRAACDELAAQTQNVLFPPISLTEDYDFSFRLFRNRRKSGLAEVWVDRTDGQGRQVKELVAIREFFPSSFAAAIRQKQRWLLGITFQGTQKLGWGRGWRERYMLLRDRIGVITALMNLAAFFIIFVTGEEIAEARFHHLPWSAALPGYRPVGALSLLIDINLLLLANRLFQRAAFVARVAGLRQALVAPVRLLWSNVVDFVCAYHAVRRFVHSEYSSKPLRWMKTVHEYPSVETLLRRHRPLGDILLERRAVTPDQLREGLALQAGPTYPKRYLGEILVEAGCLKADHLLQALAVQISVTVTLREPLADHDLPLLVNQVIRPPSEARNGTSRIPSQMVSARQPPGRFSLHSAVGITSDPIARASRGGPATRHHTRSFEFAGAAARPRRTVAAVQGIRTPRLRPAGRAGALSPPRELPIAFRRVAHNASDVKPVTRLVSEPTPLPNARRFQMLHTLADLAPSGEHPVRFVAVIGTRPEAIKLAPVIAELRARAAHSGRANDVFVCVTGQHQDMVMEPLALFNIVPDLDLGLMEHDQTLTTISARVLEALGPVLDRLKPEWILVQGDTATTAMAATAAFYTGIKVAHIEAGLRSNDLQNPFPEEANRRVVSILASMHFAATDSGRKNLLREGVRESAIKVTGNTGIDALRLHCGRLNLSYAAQRRLDASQKESSGDPLRILVTAHRRENLESGIAGICQAIHSLVATYPDRFHFVWPMHPNPRVSDVARRSLAGLRDVTLTPAVGYDRLLALLAQCDIVLTDSGGLQEEAPSFAKPVLILREATERPEGVWAGMARLVGTNPLDIQTAVEEKAAEIDAERRQANLVSPEGSEDMDSAPQNPYGDGRAAARIADFFSGIPVREFVYATPRNTSRMPAHVSDARPRAPLHAIQHAIQESGGLRPPTAYNPAIAEG